MTGSDELARMIDDAERIVFFTGAGISTASGIPDFRSPDTGLWNQPGAIELFTVDGFRQDPDGFYRFSAPLFEQMSAARPNVAHRLISILESRGKVLSVITQNIDGLHQRAGSTAVRELHGGGSESTCQACGEIFDTPSVFRDASVSGAAPKCGACGGVIKPNVVFFGEMLPTEPLAGAEFDSRNADLFVVAGSSLTVMPAALMPGYAVEAGADLVIINDTETPYDGIADVRIEGEITEVFTMLAESLGIDVKEDE